MKSILPWLFILGFLSFPQFGTATTPEDEAADAKATAAVEPGDELLLTIEAPLLSPLFADTPVAVVDEEPITFRDLTRRIASIHAGREDQATTATKDYVKLLERVITTKLIVQEARNIGLDELPEVQSQIDQVSTQLLAASLMSPQLETVEADQAEVDELYKKMSREFLLTALRFKREEDALVFQGEYDETGDFIGLATRFVEAGRAEGDVGGQEYVKLKDLLPQIAKAVFEMDADSLSPIFTVDGGFLLFYLDDMRFYEDAEVREEARQTILKPLKKEKADEYVDWLIAEYATVDRDLLDQVDFEKETTGYLWAREEKPVDYQKLLDDDRVLATIRGDSPSAVTVGDLAGEVQRRRFHGVEEAAKKGLLNKEKWRVLRDILFRRTLRIEAIRQGKDQSEEYLDAIDEFTNSLLFDTFVKKVVSPDVKISDEEARGYYAEHLDDFSSPTMYRMNGLAFYTVRDAESALMKLRRGADFTWVSANSPGQIDKEAEETLEFDGLLLSATALPGELRKATEGARPGDSLLYSSTESHHYVITIERVFPAQPRPYEDVRQSIAGMLAEEKVRALIDDWSEKLEEAYETRIFVTGLGE
jgi:parvulin-like peptidyl-prolyl isomerase